MIVKELFDELSKLNPNGRVVVMLDHDGNSFMTPLSVYEETDINEGTEEMSMDDIESERLWMTGDIIIDVFEDREMKKFLEDTEKEKLLNRLKELNDIKDTILKEQESINYMLSKVKE